MQGPDKFQRAWREDPIGTAFKTAIWITLPQVLSWWLLKDNEDYQELPNWEKKIYTHFPIPGTDRFLAIPSPHGWGYLFGWGIQHILDEVFKSDKSVFSPILDDIKKIPGDVALAWALPTWAVPVVENAMNYSTFREGEIVNYFDRNLPPEEQYNRWTTETAKVIGKAINYSPAKIDNMIYGYTAGYGRGGTYVSDAIISSIDNKAKPVRPSLTMGDKVKRTPGLGAFISGNPRGASQSVADVVRMDKKLSGLRQMRRKITNVDERRKFDAQHPELKKYLWVPKTMAKIRKHFTAIKNIANDMIIRDPDVKRTKVDQHYTEIVRLARAALKKETK